MLQVFLNIVLDDAVEEKAGGEKVRIGMVVRVFLVLESMIEKLVTKLANR